jgi:hypothetical protein
MLHLALLMLPAGPAMDAQNTAPRNSYTAALADVDLELQNTINRVREEVAPVVDCLVSEEHHEDCTLEQLWNWSTPWCKARFVHFHSRLCAEGSVDAFLNAVKQWTKFCDAVYGHGQGDKYRVTAPKVATFMDYWTSKERTRPLVNPFSTLKSYIGTGLMHLMFLQEAATMSLQQLQAAELKQLTTEPAVAAKLNIGLKRVSKRLAIQ